MNDTDDLIRMIRDSADAMGDKHDLGRVRRLRFSSPGFDRATLSEMAQLGWIGLLVPESDGGAGLGIGALAGLAQELGTRLTPEPLIETAIAAFLLEGEARGSLIGGSEIILPAWQSAPDALAPDSDIDLSGATASGTFNFVWGGEAADGFLLLGKECAALVRRDARGVTVTSDPTVDGGHHATIILNDAEIAGVTVSADAVADAFDCATLAVSAYLLGLTERAFEMTLEYLRMRVQFGKIIGTFQALQHRAADLAVQIALTKASLANSIEVMTSGASAAERRSTVSRTKARAADVSLLVTRQAIQLHGGIGFTDEHDIGLFLRRAMVMANAYGSASLHRRRYDDLNRDHLLKLNN